MRDVPDGILSALLCRKNIWEIPIDIHAGGEDLVFPHHENEIAQSEAANGKTFCKILDAQCIPEH